MTVTYTIMGVHRISHHEGYSDRLMNQVLDCNTIFSRQDKTQKHYNINTSMSLQNLFGFHLSVGKPNVEQAYI